MWPMTPGVGSDTVPVLIESNAALTVVLWFTVSKIFLYNADRVREKTTRRIM